MPEAATTSSAAAAAHEDDPSYVPTEVVSSGEDSFDEGDLAHLYDSAPGESAKVEPEKEQQQEDAPPSPCPPTSPAWGGAEADGQ